MAASGCWVWRSWDTNYNGTAVSVPTQVSGLSGISAIGGGFFYMLAVAADGTTYSWGLSDVGQARHWAHRHHRVRAGASAGVGGTGQLSLGPNGFAATSTATGSTTSLSLSVDLAVAAARQQRQHLCRRAGARPGILFPHRYRLASVGRWRNSVYHTGALSSRTLSLLNGANVTGLGRHGKSMWVTAAAIANY